MRSRYSYTKLWRLKHPAQRNADRKRNYALGREGVTRSRREWMSWELDAITAVTRPRDRELAKQLGRSVQAIQIKRARVRVTA